MAKQKTAFVCNDCGSDYVKWQGQCSDCEAWNTLTEIRLGPEKGSGRAGAQMSGKRAGFAGALDSARVLRISTYRASLAFPPGQKSLTGC